MSLIHPQAIVHPSAFIGKNVRIDPFCTISKDVVIGDNCHIYGQVHIHDGVRIENGCSIFQGSILGSDPQDLKYQGESTQLIIGEETTIREYCTINRGTKSAGKTVIGKKVLVMAYSHIAHDCIVHDQAILANNVNLAGHVEIGPFAIVGGMTAIQQFLVIGQHSFIGGGTLVRKDIPPYVKAAREPLSYIGVNTVGLTRRGFTKEDMRVLQDIYRILYVKYSNNTIGLREIQSKYGNNHYFLEISEFIASSENGVIRGLRLQS